MRISIKILSIILSVTLFIVLLNGCKKNTSTNSEQTDALQKTRAWVATQPKFTTHIVNQKLELYKEDENGNLISAKNFRSSRTLSCPSDVEPEVTFENWAATNPSCGSNNTYQLFASFTISSENAIVADNPNNSSQHTRGRTIVTVTATGANVSGFPNNNVLPVTITTVGTDPSDPNRTIYRITWLNQSVSSTAFSGANTIRVGLYFFTDCTDESQYPYTVVANITNLGDQSACQVVSPVFIDNPNHAINGVAACSCCNPDIMPNQQEMIFSRAGVPDFPLTIGIADTYFPTTTQMAHGYTYTVKYRNKVTGGTACTGPWLYPSISVYWP